MTSPAADPVKPNASFRTLWRFLPMLWPAGQRELKARVITAVLLVLAGKGAVLLMPWAYKAVVDRMTGSGAAFSVVATLVLAYTLARFAGVLSDNLRNALFEKVGQTAAYTLAGQVLLQDLRAASAGCPARARHTVRRSPERATGAWPLADHRRRGAAVHRFLRRPRTSLLAPGRSSPCLISRGADIPVRFAP